MFYVCLSSVVAFIFLLLQYYTLKTQIKLLSISNWLVFLLFNFFYTYTFLINPGYPKRDETSIKGGMNMKYCGVCEMWVNKKGTVHCDECDICIEGYDHHCPWTSKCIGKRNMWSFIGFVVMVFFILIYFTFSAVLTAEALSPKGKHANNNNNNKLI